MSRPIIPIVVVAIWAVAQNALPGTANGTPSNSSRYQHGSR